MPPPALPTAVTPSLLDRLTDPEAGGPGLRFGYTVDQMMASVRADLETLLNTRAGWYDVPDEFPETAKSVAAFGLPDLTSVPCTTDSDLDSIGQELAAAIARFEPRLRSVRVGLLEDLGTGLRQVRFQVDATLAMDPAPEIGFITVFELTTGQASVDIA